MFDIFDFGLHFEFLYFWYFGQNYNRLDFFWDLSQVNNNTVIHVDALSLFSEIFFKTKVV